MLLVRVLTWVNATTASLSLIGRIGESLRGGLRSSITQSFSTPGQHGAKPKVRASDYGIKMIAKQKLKFYYANLTESKLRKVYKRALAYKGDVSFNFLRLIESRLDG
ncbi:hypothetical protein AAHH88_00230 [Candidatus Hodgkinia cicadicola]